LLYHRVCNWSNTTGASSGIGTTYPSGSHMSSLRTPVFSGIRVAWSLVFCVVFCRSLFVPVSSFVLATVLSVLLRFTDSDYPFGIFELFLQKCPNIHFVSWYIKRPVRVFTFHCFKLFFFSLTLRYLFITIYNLF